MCPRLACCSQATLYCYRALLGGGRGGASGRWLPREGPGISARLIYSVVPGLAPRPAWADPGGPSRELPASITQRTEQQLVCLGRQPLSPGPAVARGLAPHPGSVSEPLQPLLSEKEAGSWVCKAVGMSLLCASVYKHLSGARPCHHSVHPHCEGGCGGRDHGGSEGLCSPPMKPSTTAHYRDSYSGRQDRGCCLWSPTLGAVLTSRVVGDQGHAGGWGGVGS